MDSTASAACFLVSPIPLLIFAVILDLVTFMDKKATAHHFKLPFSSIPSVAFLIL